jgi:hypothetical protein
MPDQDQEMDKRKGLDAVNSFRQPACYRTGCPY